jgi:hypothetical protein
VSLDFTALIRFPHHRELNYITLRLKRIQANHHLIGLRFLVADTDSPVFFKLPALPIPLIVTSNSNSPPILSLHCTQTRVSGKASIRARGISFPHFLQFLVSTVIFFAPGLNPKLITLHFKFFVNTRPRRATSPAASAE